jgi:glycosyltransferase involved in cell wall biosynthesis
MPEFRSLLVCDILPWRQFGGSMRCATVGRALARLGPVDLLVLTNGSYPVPADIPFSRVQLIQEEPPRVRARLLQPLTGAPAARIWQTRRQVRRAVEPWVTGGAYDVVWYARERSWLKTRGLLSAPSVVDVDDFEDVLLRRWLALGRTSGNEPLSAASRVAMRRDARWWASVHRRTACAADVLVFASEDDRERCGAPGSVVVPNTYEEAAAPAAPDGEPLDTGGGPTVLFQGALTWPPNEDAAVWLVREIAPVIRAVHPGLRIVLAGSPSPRVRELDDHPGVQVVGRVPWMKPYLAAADLVVVPLRVGGGTRIKILESFACGVPVVSTSIGAEGLGVRAGVHLDIGDSVADIARACLRLLGDPDRGQMLVQQAHAFYERNHRAEHAERRVHEAVQLATRSRR